MGTMTVDATRFAAECLHLLDAVADHGTTVVVTGDGTPVTRLVPPESEPAKTDRPLFGFAKGTFTILGDIMEPAAEPRKDEPQEPSEGRGPRDGGLTVSLRRSC